MRIFNPADIVPPASTSPTDRQLSDNASEAGTQHAHNNNKIIMNQFDMQGRHAVITGGANGLGYAVVSRMLASGASVTIWDRDATAIDRAVAELRAQFTGATIRSEVVEVTDYTQVVRAAKALAATGVDIVVNSAGVSGPNLPLCDYPVDAWQQVMNVNVNGTFYVCRELVPLMKLKQYGRIVNIASIAGKEGNPNASAYSASKAAVIGLTKSLGKELAKAGITVNCVTPAAVKTRIFDQQTPEHIQFMLSKIPMGRFGLPEEVASLVCWLCTEECSFSSGAVFDISGGRATY